MASLVDGKVRVVAALRSVLSPARIPWTAQSGFVARAVWKKVKSDLVRATSKDGLIGSGEKSQPETWSAGMFSGGWRRTRARSLLGWRC